MDNRAFFEVIVTPPAGSGFDLADRDEIEDALEEVLSAADLGEITGAGAGLGVFHLDVEVDPERVREGLAVLLETLRRLEVPAGTYVRGPGLEERHPVDAPADAD